MVNLTFYKYFVVVVDVVVFYSVVSPPKNNNLLLLELEVYWISSNKWNRIIVDTAVWYYGKYRTLAYYIRFPVLGMISDWFWDNGPETHQMCGSGINSGNMKRNVDQDL